MYAGNQDTIATLEEVRWTRDQLSSIVHYEEIDADHFTFIHGKDMTYF